VGRILALAVVVLSAALLQEGAGMIPEPDAADASRPPEHAVVVELFTSQGCSSCPPADRLLESLGAESAGRVVPLAFHVDFWDSLGWKDPFSRHAWTERQTDYARAFRSQNVYTPQAIVDGRVEMVGSDAGKLRSAIASSAARPAGRISLELQPAASQVLVRVDVERPETLRSRKLDLMIALYETGLVTAVGKGENGGSTLRNDYVVRVLRRAGRLSSADSHKEFREEISIEKGWDRARLGVAAFLQDPSSLEICGAGARPLAPRDGG
jgi:hypothetical protein